MNQVEIAEQPLIAINDILAYNPRTHEITLNANAYGRISSLEVPVNGRSFVVCLDRKPFYTGAFWTPVSSIAFDGVTIWKPASFQGSNIIKLTNGYPSQSSQNDEDPRSNAELMNSLIQAGKLSTLPPALLIDSIPSLMKGWDLYSWQEENDWHFTLMYGTNRLKSVEEIISVANSESHIHVVGVEAINLVLSKVSPENEGILWLSNPREPYQENPTTEKNLLDSTAFSLPPQEIVNTVLKNAKNHGVILDVYQP